VTGNLAALIQVTVDAGLGNDTLLGCDGADTIDGQHGNDDRDGIMGIDAPTGLRAALEAPEGWRFDRPRYEECTGSASRRNRGDLLRRGW
jgi:hypothetical protein